MIEDDCCLAAGVFLFMCVSVFVSFTQFECFELFDPVVWQREKKSYGEYNNNQQTTNFTLFT